MLACKNGSRMKWSLLLDSCARCGVGTSFGQMSHRLKENSREIYYREPTNSESRQLFNDNHDDFLVLGVLLMNGQLVSLLEYGNSMKSPPKHIVVCKI